MHIDTVGVGTAAGTTVDVEGYHLFTGLDEATLKSISQTTGGTYHPASDASELNGIASSINLRLTVTHQPLPLAGAFIAWRSHCSPRGPCHRRPDGPGGLMSFSWPWALLALLILPLVFAAWWLARRMRKRATVARHLDRAVQGRPRPVALAAARSRRAARGRARP